MQAGYPEVVSSEIAKIRDADGVSHTGRQQSGARQTPARHSPAESKTPRMHGNFTRENREAPLLSAAGRGGPVGESDER